MLWKLKEIKMSADQGTKPQNPFHILITPQQHPYENLEEWAPHQTPE